MTPYKEVRFSFISVLYDLCFFVCIVMVLINYIFRAHFLSSICKGNVLYKSANFKSVLILQLLYFLCNLI
jgi:hypothetical protein